MKDKEKVIKSLWDQFEYHTAKCSLVTRLLATILSIFSLYYISGLVFLLKVYWILEILQYLINAEVCRWSAINRATDSKLHNRVVVFTSTIFYIKMLVIIILII